MNAPDRYERFVVPEHAQKVTREIDTKVRHAATFVIEREDHTVGNIVRMQLHRDPNVIFAGYKVPHPLEYKLLIKVQTKGGQPPQGGEPPQALMNALTDLTAELDSIGTQFQEAVAAVRPQLGEPTSPMAVVPDYQ
ncbi:hypothetical protein WJX73_004731 [Symbiochloris irregularis]|uniref:DNA-directed RNA polymerase RBP11-like dimerisation domain-containing protein n=1 Tax=Symbiochloris irregularis TaxID=706552 RepID=A0AAW1P6B0_9CHLO